MKRIHPSSIVDPGAEPADGVEIGPSFDPQRPG